MTQSKMDEQMGSPIKRHLAREKSIATVGKGIRVFHIACALGSD